VIPVEFVLTPAILDAWGGVPIPPEQNLIEWAKQFLVPGKMFIDVGAHVGSWSLQYAAMGCQVRAFEPQLTPCILLHAARDINKLHHEITIHCEAMVADDTNQFFDIGIVSRDGGGSSIMPLTTHEPSKLLGVEKVRCGRLDEYLDHRACLIKIDVEGAEAAVVRGGIEGLRRAGYPKILLESWRPERMPEAAALRADVFSVLSDLGYEIIPLNLYDEMFLVKHKGDSQ
jgi:FkbM family methyltransferase